MLENLQVVTNPMITTTDLTTAGDFTLIIHHSRSHGGGMDQVTGNPATGSANTCSHDFRGLRPPRLLRCVVGS